MFSLRGPGLKWIALVLAVISLGFGTYLTFFHSRGFVKTEGTIVSLREEVDEADDSSTYFPTVEYTVDGKTYTAELNTGSGSYKVGNTITVLYDPNNPGVAHSGGGFGIYLMILGVAILAILIFSTVKGKQEKRQIAEIQQTKGATGYAPSVQGEEREVYFLTDTGTAKYGHRIEDRSRRVLYEAKMTKFSVATAHSFDFIDHEHGTTTPHLVGHTEETDWGNSLLLDNHSTFELDGVDVWTHLKQNGISVETQTMEASIFPRYHVLRNGTEIAIIESSSQYVHEEDAEQHSVASKIAYPGYYRIWTREQNLDVIFVTALAFARSGAMNDEGGTFGKQIRTATFGK